MSKFSELLAEICQDRNISSELLSKLSGVERTQTYRLLKGTRKPSGPKQVRQISRALQLSIQEAEELDRALQIDTVGYMVFERRKYLNKVIQDLSFLSSHKSQVSFVVDLKRKEDYRGNVTFVQGKQEIRNVFRMLFNEEGLKKDGEINLFLNPGQGVSDAYDILDVQEESTLKIHHLLLFDNGKEGTNDINNLQSFFSLIPALIKNRSYEPRVCYEKLTGIESKVVFFPYYCIAGDYIFEISSDGSNGRLIRDAICAAYFRNKFMFVYSRSIQLAIARSDLEEIINFYIDLNSKARGTMSYVLEAQAGISRYVTLGNLTNTLKAVSTGVQTAVDNYIFLESQILQNQKNIMQRDSKAGLILSFFTEEGMRLFLEEGKVIQVPEELYAPFPMQERYEIMGRLIDDAKSGQLLLRMIDEDKFRLPLTFSILSTDSLVGMALYPSETKYWTFEVEEVSATLAIKDYIEYLSDSDLVFGQEESIRRLEELMASVLDNVSIRQS